MKNKKDFFEKIFIIVSIVSLIFFIGMVYFLETFSLVGKNHVSAVSIQAAQASQTSQASPRKTIDPYITAGNIEK